METNKIIQGDCLEEMKKLPDESVDAVITDPPYGLSFMGKEWDGFTNNQALQEWTKEWAEECFRVLKSGGHLLSFGGTRTYHRITTGIEDAGFEIRDTIQWIYNTGFPKSLNIGKAVDKKLGIKRKIIGYTEPFGRENRNTSHSGGFMKENMKYKNELDKRPIYDSYSEWEGFGTALKPAHEPIVLARKPIKEKSIIENVLSNGCGGLNIDGCRIPIKGNDDRSAGKRTKTFGNEKEPQSGGEGSPDYNPDSKGRFPANVICQDDALNDGEITKNQGHWSKTKTTGFGKFGGGNSEYSGVGEKDKSYGSKSRYFDLDIWAEKQGIFNIPKPSKAEKNKGCENLEGEYESYIKNRRCKKCGYQEVSGSPCKCENPEWEIIERKSTTKNNHPTCKPVKLMAWLVKLVSKQGDIVLDPFIGSGTTGIACKKLNRNFIGIEKEEEYVKIAKARINAEVQTGLN